MSTEIGGRPVLRPAGNVAPALRTNIHHHARKQQTAKPPPSPAKKPSPPPPAASPPNSQPSTPKGTPAAALPGPQARSPVATVPVPQARSPKLPPRKSVPRISLNKSSNDVFQNSITTTTSTSSSSTKNANAKNARTQPPPKKSFSKLGSLSLDETSLADIVAAKKTAASELFLQRKFKVAEYGRKQGKVSRVAPDFAAAPPLPPLEPRRCKFITPQTDALYVAYHDEEWGVPVHDDRRQFELLVLSGLLVDLSWSTILCKRDTYRVAFCGFDPVAVASFSEKHIQLLEADRSLTLRGGKIRGIVENARCILEVAHEFGSLDKYLWGFLNNKPMINSFRYPKQVPVKTSKSESISKDLVRRGFRFVGPTVIYSFMQSAGMTNDHLLECYRHQECSNTHLSSHQASQDISEHSQYYTSSDPCNISSLAMDMDHDTGKTV